MTNILLLCANPSDTSRLQLDREVREIESAIRKSPNREAFQITTHLAVRASDLQTLLLRYTPDIVHFAGHGTENSGIILEDEQGLSYPVSTSALKQLFSLFGERIKCVILNTVFSEATANVMIKQICFCKKRSMLVDVL